MGTKIYTKPHFTKIRMGTAENCIYCGSLVYNNVCGHCGDMEVMHAAYEQLEKVPYPKSKRRVNRD